MKGISQIHIFLLMTLLPIMMLPSPVSAGTDVVLSRIGDQSEPAIAVSPLDSGLVLAGSIDINSRGEGLGLNYFVSRDGGITWPTRGDIPKAGKTFQADPSVGFDRFGNAWFLGLTFSQGFPDCDHSLFATHNSGDISSGWANPEVFMFGGDIVIDGTRATECHDKPYLAVDNTGGPFDGTAYVSWTFFRRVHGVDTNFKSDIFLTYRRGGTWLLPFDVIRVSNDGNSQFSDLEVAPDGTVYITWVSGATGAIHLSKFDPSTNTPSAPTQIVKLKKSPQSLPFGQLQSLAVDQLMGDIVYVVYTDVLDITRTDTDIFLVRSTDRGTTWSVPKRVNDDPLTATDQFFPWITTTKGSTSAGVGRVDIAFYDKRSDPENNVLFETWLATSADRGEKIQPNIGVSDRQYQGVNVLHYLGMASVSKEARPVWTGKASDTALHQDIITDRISFFDLEAGAVLSTAASFTTAPLVSLDSGAWFAFSRLFSVPPASHTLTASVCADSGAAMFNHWEDLSGTVISTSRTVALDVLADRSLRAVYFQQSCLQGDVNKSCAVNVLDLARVGSAFLKSTGLSGYDVEADVFNDGTINVQDLALIGSDFLRFVSGPACSQTSSSLSLALADGVDSSASTSMTLRGETVSDPGLVAGSTFTSSFFVRDAVDLFAWQLNVTFNRAVLNVVSISLGSYWIQADGSTNLYDFRTSISNDKGNFLASFTFIEASSTKQPAPLTSTADTILVTITWKVMANDSTTTLHIVNSSENAHFGSLVADSNIVTMGYTTLDGSFSNKCTRRCPL